MFDFKTGAILFFIIMAAVYVANFQAHKMIVKAEDERARLSTPPTATVEVAAR